MLQKAIQESEAEWAQNKKLVDLKDRDVQKAVSKPVIILQIIDGHQNNPRYVYGLLRIQIQKTKKLLYYLNLFSLRSLKVSHTLVWTLVYKADMLTLLKMKKCSHTILERLV